MTTLYWQVYKNLEREFLLLADIIHIDDNQLSVYSMKIADLLIRSVIEIEALAKELYLTNGGAVVPDEEMYFDTVCMKHLDDMWKLDKKEVLVVTPNLYLEKEDNRLLTPLHKASKRGTSSAKWNRAYQAVKHNRVKDLTKGNIKNLLDSLAALYLLNLYYKDTQIQNVVQGKEKDVDSSFGSDLFAIKIHQPGGLSTDGAYAKKADYDSCVYICDFEVKSTERALEALRALNKYTNDAMLPILVNKIKQKVAEGMNVTQELVDAERINAIKEVFPIKDNKLLKLVNDNLGKYMYNIVLNKQQY